MYRPSGLFVAAACVALVLVAAFASVTAHAAQRTFVASYGSDAAGCSLNTPCRSFGTAIAHTDDQGEIIVLDSAGYGRVTVTKSVSIVAPAGIHAGISVFAGENGVDVAGAGIVVKLRGLTINGQGGVHGISFTQGTSLYVEQCVVSDMGGHAIRLDTGIAHVTDSTLRNNAGDGIRVQSGAAIVVDRSRLERNGTGVHVVNGPAVTISNSLVSGNIAAGIHVESTNGSDTDAAVTESNVSHNVNAGIRAIATGAGSVVRLLAARNTIGFNGGTGFLVDTANSGFATAMISDNAIMRNLDNGITAKGGPTTDITLSANAISGNSPNGVLQANNAMMRTRSNNVAQHNLVNDVDAFVTPVTGD